MRSRRKLRFRLIVSFALFGFGLSALFAVSTLYLRAKVENQLINDSLRNDVDQAVDNALEHPERPFQSELIEGWVKSDRTLYKMPLAWQNLSSGVHDIRAVDADGRQRHYKLAVQRKNGIIGFTRYDISREDLGKRQLVLSLIGAVLLFSLLSLAIGLWLSRRVLKPVTELANPSRAPRLPRRDHRGAGRLRESDTVRVIDALAVHKDAEGEITVAQLSNLTKDEEIELGAKIGALVGLGAAGEEGAEALAEAGAEAAAEDGVNVFSDNEEVWDVLADIPNDTAAALLLIEHHWAVPLRDAIARANGFRIADGFISPLDLVAIGLLTAAEAEAQAEALKPSATV